MVIVGFAWRSRAFQSRTPWSSGRMSARSYSKWIRLARRRSASARPAAIAAFRAASARAAESRAAAARESARRRAASSAARRAESGSATGRVAVVSGCGITSSGAGGLQAAAKARSVRRKSERVVISVSGPSVQDSGVISRRQAPGPRWEPCYARRLDLPKAARLEVEDPDLPPPAPIGDEGDMTPVRGPGRILVASGGGELPDTARHDVVHEQLRHAAQFTVEDHVRPVRRPFRRVGGSGRPEIEGDEKLLAGAILRHLVHLREARSRAH